MDFSFASILALGRFTVQDPRAAARSLMAMQLPDAARWLLLGVVATASAVLTHVGFNLLPASDAVFLGDAMKSPVQTAFFQGGFLLLTVAAIYTIGKWRGGTGSFADTLLLIGWLQFILLWLQLAQILFLFVSPPLAETLGVLGLGLSIWLLTQFVAALHGFTSGWRVFLGILGAILIAGLAISVLLTVVFGVRA